MLDRNNLIGKQIGGSYVIIAEIGEGIGSSGNVYLGEHIVFTERPRVAIKLLHTYLLSQEHDRFTQEARLLEKLVHPHILPIVQAGIRITFHFS